MRVTQRLLFESTMRELDTTTRKLLNLQKQAAYGRRVLRPSDDPLAAQRIQDLKASLRRIDPALRNGQYVQSWLQISESTMQEMEETLERAKELATSQSSSTASASTRQMTAEELKNLYDQIVQLANTRLGDRYIFGGSQTQSPVVERDDLFNPTYTGNGQEIQVRTNGQETIAMNVTARDMLETNGVLETLRDLINALEANDTTAITAQLTGLDQGMAALNDFISDVGSRSKVLERQGEAQKDAQIDLQETLSEYEDADIARVLTELTTQQTVYEAALRTTAMITRTSLVDYIE
jgi:flagellar hook-associated protein 3 FlgL